MVDKRFPLDEDGTKAAVLFEGCTADIEVGGKKIDSEGGMLLMGEMQVEPNRNVQLQLVLLLYINPPDLVHLPFSLIKTFFGMLR